MDTTRSRRLFAEAQERIPGGVNSPVRAFRAVGGGPIFIDRGLGSRIRDVDGNEYIDFVCSWGPLILGHSHPSVIEAICAAAAKGTTYGAPTEGEVELARMISEAFPSIEMSRLVSSGTEAVMSAARVARGFTGRAKIVKFEGCYHGHSDQFLAKAGSGVATLGVPDSAGVPPSMAADTVILPYNDIDSVRDLFDVIGREIAAVIVEPVAGNMGVVPPRPGYLEGLRAVTARHGALLVFDEVITGFRVAYGGAQELYGVRPDLTTLGKIVGGGLPLGAYGGRREVMESVAPVGPVYQAGTLSGNPLAVAAGLATLKALRETTPYARLDALTRTMVDSLRESAARRRVDLTVNQVGSMYTAFFAGNAVHDYESARASDTGRYAAYFRSMLESGVYLAPSQFEAAFVSSAHTSDDISRACSSAGTALGGV